jgi:aerobic carbon-monoxide dehydrogenase medium subunit
MYSADFDYRRARSIPEALDLIASNPGGKLLAGGHTLIPLLKLRLAMPSAVIDIGRIPELRGIAVRDGALRIGALTTHAELAASADVKQSAAALAEAAAQVGDPAVRNRGTIGGNIAHADPASDLPTVLVALGARIEAVGPRGLRAIEAGRFFTGIMSTELADDEIVSDVVVPVPGRGQGSAYAKFSHPASRYAVVGAAALVTVSEGTCSAVSIALGGLLPHARRLPSVEKALTGQPPNDAAVAAAAGVATADVGGDANGDLFASADYRKAMAPVYVKRALQAAIARAGRS